MTYSTERDSHDDHYDIHATLIHYGWDLPPERSGWVSVRCGEHDDHHASARINADLGAVKCLACDFGGDVISVIRQKEQCSYREAVAIAQALTGDEHGDVRSQRGSGRAVPGSPRNRPADRRYSPPRLRSRSTSGG